MTLWLPELLLHSFVSYTGTCSRIPDHLAFFYLNDLIERREFAIIL